MGARLPVGGFALAYLGAIVAIGILDGVWLGLVAKGMYQREMGALMAPSFRVWTAGLFYVLYPLAVVYLCVHVQPASAWEAVVRGACSARRRTAPTTSPTPRSSRAGR